MSMSPNPEKPVYDCETCEGDGFGVNEETPCPDCNGTGKEQS